jgi:hypothetical protein
MPGAKIVTALSVFYGSLQPNPRFFIPILLRFAATRL